MKKPDLEFYREQRLAKRKQRQSKQIKQMGLLAILIMFVLINVIILISKPSMAKIRTAASPTSNIQSNLKIVFAKSGKLKLYLPIKREQLTTIGFHESFNPQALKLNPVGDEINTKKYSKKEFLQLKNTRKKLFYSIMWRGARSGPINSAVDVGSKANTLNLSPISGRVVKIRNYKLYSRYPDKEIHILPEGYNDRHLVVIHIDRLRVKTGDKVIANLTPLGYTRHFSKIFKQQLADYSKEAGDHVHYQVNKLVNGKCSPLLK